MNRFVKRIMAAMLVLAVVLTASPMLALAAEEDDVLGLGATSWRYQDGEYVAVEEVEELPEDDLLPMAEFVMWTRNANGVYVSSNGKEIVGALRRGVDVSEWNGTINWEKAQADDVSFAIIRCGGRFMTSRKLYGDSEFERNVKECERLGIPYGVYFFSTANSVTDAREEAQYTLKCIKGHNPTMPFYYDLEWEDLASTSNRKLLADMSKVFCEEIAAAGYEPGIYASLSWWDNYLVDPCFENWTRWVAQYYSRCQYEGAYDIWQCTGTGTIDGFPGSVDINFDFRANWGAKGEWVQESGGWKYKYEDGTYASGSLVSINGAVYTFNSKNVALTGWQKINDTWYYFNPETRAMQRGWLKIDSTWYYLDPSTGKMATGWAKVSDVWYYLDPETGAMKNAEVFEVKGTRYIAKDGGACPASSWVQLGKKWYLTNGSCALRTGWADVNGKRYYLDPSTGVMKASETFVVDGKTYKADASGVVTEVSGSTAEGWVSSGSKWKYRKADGTFATSTFLTINGSTYYFDANGIMQTGWVKVDGKWYWFNNSGIMKTNGWVSGTYYVGADGAMLVSTKTPDGYYVDASGKWVGEPGWKQSGSRWWYMFEDGTYPASEFEKINGSWYFFDKSGWMVTGWAKLSGVWYYLKPSGVMATGWTKVSGSWYYFDTSSGKMETGWLKLGDTWYYLKSSGAMATGWQEVDGKWYWFYSSGAMKANGWVSGKYYVGSNGAMLVNTTTPDGYKVGPDGAWIRS